jgi:predicted nucleotidyltransferase
MFAGLPAPAKFSPTKIMNAEPLLTSVVAALAEVRLEAVLIGNAAAAIQGAPVTTVDFDFMFRSIPVNLAKLKRFARRLDAVILRPYYPASALYRVMNDDRGLQADFMPAIHGVKSFNSLRSRAEKIKLGGHDLWVAALADIIASKRAAARPRDKAVLEILEKTLREKSKAT